MSAFTQDRWYQREIVTDELDEACDAIAAGLGIARSAVGTKGNEAHDSGSHRSQEWILNSPFCDNRSYTVQPGLTADQARHIAGVDITPGQWGTTANRRRTAEITARVIAEMKAGRLDIVREVYGAAPDLRTVTGYNNVENRAASSDSSHLDHPHLGLDRKRLRDRAALAHLVAVVIGDDMPSWDDKIGGTGYPDRTFRQVFQDLSNQRDWEVSPEGTKVVNVPAPNSRAAAADQAARKILTQPPVQPAPVDQAALNAAVKAALLDPEFLAAVAKAVADEDHRRSAE